MNKAFMEIIGNVAADAVLVPGIEQDGNVTRQPRITFGVVVNHYWQENGQGHTTYPCTLWGPLAEKLAPSIIKGKLVCVEGLPTLYDCGAIIPGTEKTVRGFNLRIDRVYLGPNSKKSQEGTIADPGLLKVLQTLCEKDGINMQTILKEASSPPKDETTEGAGENKSETDTPFGNDENTDTE